MISGLLIDLRFAVRQIVKKPGFSAVIVLSLALAIGANAAIFSLVNTVVLATVKAPEPDRLVAVYTTDVKNPGHLPISDQNGRDIETQTEAVMELTAYTFMAAQVEDRGAQGARELVPGMILRGNYFDVLDIEPEVGRLFSHRDEELGAHPVVVLGHGLWQERFGGAPEIVGQTILVNGSPVEVIGVTQEGFRGTTLVAPGLFVPYSAHRELMPTAKFFDQRRFLAFFGVARLKPGVTLDQANAELERVGANLADTYPDVNEGRSFTALPISHSLIGPDDRDVVIAASALMLTVVGFILLIACANAANLLLARAATRRAEVAVRQVLGATPRRILRQVLTESLVLALLSAALGLALASPLAGLLWDLRPEQLPIGELTPEVDPTVLLYTAGLAVVAGILFGLAPALRASRLDLMAPLKEETTPATAFGRRGGLRSALVILQVALSTVALAGAGLFLRSMENARNAPPGFNVQQTLLVDVNMSQFDGTPEAMATMRTEALATVRELPEVDAAAVATRAAFTQQILQRTVYVDGVQTGEEDGVLFNINHVGARYFATSGQNLLEGREFGEHDRDDRDLIAVVNTAFAQRYWPEASAVGKRIRFMGTDDPIQIVGVVETAKMFTATEDPVAAIYVPLAQWPQPVFVMYIRTNDPAAAAPVVEAALSDLHGAVRPNNLRPMAVQMEAALFGPRVAAILLGSLGALGLALAIVGLYGVMSYSVRQRTREIGIRMALGAGPGRVRRLVMLQAVPLVAVGLLIGIGGALLAQAALSPLLYEVPWGDPIAFVGASVVLCACAAVAAFIPAFAATRISPNTAIHHD